jgi:mannose-6-phosphate isomerase
LSHLLTAPLPDNVPIGEAWMLSDRPDHTSHVVDGLLEGLTIRQLLERYPHHILGNAVGQSPRFPLLIKYLDAREMLSVQVHPADSNSKLLPREESGKTEAWVVLEAGTNSRIYAGLKPGATPEKMRRALAQGAVTDLLASFTPKVGDCVFLPAGIVHALGKDVVVFEIQQNSDVTFRLFDWDRVDAITGKPREIQVENAMACIDFAQGAVLPVAPNVEKSETLKRENLIRCEYFQLWRCSGKSPFTVGREGRPRILACVDGEGHLQHNAADYVVCKGDVLLIPAEIGQCVFLPRGAATLLEVALPESNITT